MFYSSAYTAITIIKVSELSTQTSFKHVTMNSNKHRSYGSLLLIHVLLFNLTQLTAIAADHILRPCIMPQLTHLWCALSVFQSKILFPFSSMLFIFLMWTPSRRFLFFSSSFIFFSHVSSIVCSLEAGFVIIFCGDWSILPIMFVWKLDKNVQIKHALNYAFTSYSSASLSNWQFPLSTLCFTPSNLLSARMFPSLPPICRIWARYSLRFCSHVFVICYLIEVRLMIENIK